MGFLTQTVAYLVVAAGVHYWTRTQFPVLLGSGEHEGVADVERFSCRPFLPKLFEETPPQAHHAAIRAATKRLDTFLSDRVSQGDIDGLSVAVVTSAGPLFEQNWGVQRGNESKMSPPMTSHSVHRISSVAKIFPVLEGLILEQRGVISWCVFGMSSVCSGVDSMPGTTQ